MSGAVRPAPPPPKEVRGTGGPPVGLAAVGTGAKRSAAPVPTYHWLKLRALCHPTEDVARVRKALEFVAGAAVDVDDTAVETHHGLALHVLEASLEKSRALRNVLDRIFEVEGALEVLRASVDSRTDDDGVFFLRVEKQDAFLGKLTLTSGEDCIQIRLKVEAYPANREAALGVLREILAAGRA
jgi:RNA binding exosome subunit